MPEPYLNHAAQLADADLLVGSQTQPDTVPPASIETVDTRSAAMVDCLRIMRADGSEAYYGVDPRTSSSDDAADWYTIVKRELELASAGDRFHLPGVVIQPGAGVTAGIQVAVPGVTIFGNGSTFKRGANTTTGVGTYFLEFTKSAQNAEVKDMTFDGNGDLAGLADQEGYTVATRCNAKLTNCYFRNPLNGPTDSFHLRHWPEPVTQDRLILDGCRFEDAGFGTVNVNQGSILATNCTFEILNDLNGSGIWDSFPQQRIMNVSVTDGYRVSDVIFEGCRFYTAKTLGSGAGGMALSGDQKVEELDEMHAAVDGTDHTGGNAITTNITNPNAREVGFENSPCIVSATAGGNDANISRVAATITGKGPNGNPITETLPPFQAGVAGTVYSQQFFSEVSQIDMPAHADADATTKFGFLPNKIDNLIFRDCVQIFERYELGHYCKWQAVHNVLYDGHRIEHLSDNLAGQYGSFRWQKGTGRVTLRNVIAPARLSSLVGELRELIIESCNFDFRSNPYNYFIEGAEDILHLDIRETLIQGFTQYCIFNTATGSLWPDYDEHATITFNHVQLRAIPTPNAYVLAYVPRIGFFRCGGYSDLNQPAVPGAQDNLYLADTSEERLMATVHDGDPRCAYYGRRLDAPGVMTGTGSGGAITYHPTNPTSVSGKRGDRIVSDYDGTDAGLGVAEWIHDGNGWKTRIASI